MTEHLRRLRVVLVVIGAVLVVGSAGGQAIRVGPVLQDASPTEMWVMWESSATVSGRVDFGPTPALGRSAVSQTTASQGSALIHHARMTGLAPGTTYHYRVRAGNAVSEVSTFRTPELQSAEAGFRFAGYSDCQGNGGSPAKHTEIVNEGIIDYVTETYGGSVPDELAFVMIPGDLVSTGSNYNQWKDQFFDEAANLAKHVPFYPVPGNHEQDAHWFFDYFKLPENGTPGYIEHWYYKDHGNVRIIGLDSNGAYRLAEQLAWLEAVLGDAASDDGIDFVFAQLHHPYLSELWSVGNTPYVGEVIDRLDAFASSSGKPAVHFFGHTHGYERGQSRDHRHLWVNVSAGEGGIDYWGAVPVADYEEFQKSFPDWGFVIVEVTAGDDPTFRLKRLSRGNDVEAKDNVVMDDITIRRYNAAPSRPLAAFPAPGETGVDPIGAVVVGTEFEDADAGDFHAESRFQFTAVPGDWSAAEEVWERFENWAAPEGATGIANGWFSVNTVADADVTTAIVPRLLPNTRYEWRVRYRDSGLRWSEWSSPSDFTTGALPTGACCLPAGGCERLIDTDCAALGGVFAGVGVECGDAGCPATVTLFSEDFDSVALGPSVDEEIPSPAVWSPTPPDGWAVDSSGLPGGGVTEWRGWTFADPGWWAATASDQGRALFTKGEGVIAVADPDEWHDAAHGAGAFNSVLTTPVIHVAGADAPSARVVFDSSWRPEGDQRAEIRVSADGGPFVAVAVWESAEGPDFKAGAENEVAVVPLGLAPGTETFRVRFVMLDAGNNWWWAIDDVRVVASPGTGRRTLLDEDFEGVPLGPNTDESVPNARAWTDTPPTGWTVDDAGVPSVGQAEIGVTEWEGWSFAEKEWWVEVASDQNRSLFTAGSGVVAVADPDEWDDRGSASGLGLYDASLFTPVTDVEPYRGRRVAIGFASSWRPEAPQRAELVAHFAPGGSMKLLEWSSAAGATFKPAVYSERVSVDVEVPLAANAMTIEFRLFDAGNNWWWAVDDVAVFVDDDLACGGVEYAPPFDRVDVSDLQAFISGGVEDFFEVLEFLGRYDECGLHAL